MKSKIEFQKIADLLQKQCPFIVFAWLAGLDEEGRLKWPGNLELFAYIGPDTGNWRALEQILPLMAALVPEAFCEVTILNQIDATTRVRAIQGRCLFIQKGREITFRQFVQHASLDYRIMRAQGRRLGIIDNE